MPKLQLRLIVFLLFISLTSFGQKNEFLNYHKEINFYLDFLFGKFDSLKVNEVNQARFTKRVDSAFVAFAKVENSHLLDTLRLAKDDTSTRFLFMDNRSSLYVKSFYSPLGYLAVYSYTSSARDRYLVKDILSNKIVVVGSRNIGYVSNFFYLDSTHVMVIEENGDQHNSRMAIVYAITGLGWKQINAFEGLSYEFNKKHELEMVFRKNRPFFKLECSFETSMLLPQDVSDIYYDLNSKMLKYKQYDANKKFKWITSKWENNIFKIDDFDADKGFSQSGVEMMR